MGKWFHAVLVIAALVASGCVAAIDRESSARPDIPAVQGFAGLERERPAPAPGAIFQADGAYNLYRDRRAHRVGDILLVKIVENSSGAKKASTKTERTSTIEGGVTSLFGIEKWLSDRNSRFTPSSTSLKADLTNDFEGTGETKRNSTVTATLSARVVEVTPDHNMIIRGFRQVKVNDETQHLILTGIVRPEDVGADNSILSTQVADARIEYGGTGVISDKQQPGWLARALDVVWPF